MKDLILLNSLLPRMPLLKTVSSEGSIQRAAESLGLTPSAVSQSVQKVEAILGVKLFKRGKDGFAATHTLDELIEQYTPFEAKVNSLREGASPSTSPTKTLHGKVRLLGQNQVLNYLASHAIASFAKAYPHVTVSIETGGADRAASLFRERKLDLAFCGALSAVNALRLERVRCIDLTVALVGRRDLVKDLKVKRSGARSISQLPHVLTYPDATLLKKFCRNARMRVPQQTLCSPVIAFDLDFVRSMVLEGVGISTMVTEFIAADLKAGTLQIVEGLPTLKHPVYLAWRKGPELTPAAVALKNWLVENLPARK